MISRLFTWFMITVIIVLSLWMLPILGEAIEAHPLFFVIVWFFIPLLALWLSSDNLREYFSLKQLKKIRIVLIVIVVLQSFYCFSSFDYIKNEVGHKLFKDFRVHYYDDINDYGGPTRNYTYETDNWYSKVGMQVFEGCFLILIIGLPSLTWYVTSKAVKSAERGSLENRKIKKQDID
ncbi:MAG: hypothetical protein P4L35_06960 [Ignavibacteriaceae bacterium]|nr:hypothetical protein [Ignavibacteriaceae bacterium]